MNNKEQIQGDETNQTPTEAEETLGSMAGKFNKTEAKREREKTKTEEDDYWDLTKLSDRELMEREKYYSNSLGEILDWTARGEQDHLNLSIYASNLDDIQKEEERRSMERPDFKEIEEIMRDTRKVEIALRNTRKTLKDYFENTCKQRLENGAGSVYDGIKTTAEMEDALFGAFWKKAEHPDVMPGCQAYVTKDIKGGHLGLLKIADLPDDVVITASDPKNTGKVSMTVSGEKGPATEETWLIIGKEEGTDVVFTFHPGEPVRPSVVEVKDCPDGTKLTKDQAIALGFDLAKIV